MAVLWIAVGLLLLAVFLSFAEKLAHLDDSVFVSYPFALYAVAYVLCYILLVNRKSYRLAVGGEVKHRTRRETLIRHSRWVSPALVAVGFMSLLFRGYRARMVTFEDIGCLSSKTRLANSEHIECIP